MHAPDVLFALVGDVRRNSRALRQVRALAEMGATVRVLTLGPPADAPELEPGVHLHVIASPSGTGPRFFWRIHRRMRKAALQVDARVYHASDLYTLPALHAAARRHGGRLAYDARELYPFVASTTGRPWTRLTWAALEGLFARRADAVFTVSDSIADRIAATLGIVRPTVVHNVPPRRDVVASGYLRETLGLGPDAVILLHQGSMRPDRGCTLLVEAMPGVTGGALVFLGDGPLRPHLKQRAVALDVDERVHFLDPVPPDELLPVTASADVGITLLEDTCLNHRFALPNKLFEYLVAGLPVLASDLPEIRGVVADHDVGLVVNPKDPSALVEVLQRMIDDDDARRRWAAHTPRVLETFGWEKSSQRFKHVYQSLLRDPGAP